MGRAIQKYCYGHFSAYSSNHSLFAIHILLPLKECLYGRINRYGNILKIYMSVKKMQALEIENARSLSVLCHLQRRGL